MKRLIMLTLATFAFVLSNANAAPDWTGEYEFAKGRKLTRTPGFIQLEEKKRNNAPIIIRGWKGLYINAFQDLQLTTDMNQTQFRKEALKLGSLLRSKITPLKAPTTKRPVFETKRPVSGTKRPVSGTKNSALAVPQALVLESFRDAYQERVANIAKKKGLPTPVAKPTPGAKKPNKPIPPMNKPTPGVKKPSNKASVLENFRDAYQARIANIAKKKGLPAPKPGVNKPNKPTTPPVNKPNKPTTPPVNKPNKPTTPPVNKPNKPTPGVKKPLNKELIRKKYRAAYQERVARMKIKGRK
jgi:hypothetical protein